MRAGDLRPGMSIRVEVDTPFETSATVSFVILVGARLVCVAWTYPDPDDAGKRVEDAAVFDVDNEIGVGE